MYSHRPALGNYRYVASTGAVCAELVSTAHCDVATRGDGVATSRMHLASANAAGVEVPQGDTVRYLSERGVCYL